MVCKTPKANHPHTSESLVAAWTFSGRHLGVTNEPHSDCFVVCANERGWKETCLWTRSASSFERSSYASTLQTSASGVSGLPLFWLKTWFWVALTSATFVRYRWTVHQDTEWPLAISLSSMFFIKLSFLTTNRPTMLFVIRLVQLAQLKPIFLSGCSLMARDNRRLVNGKIKWAWHFSNPPLGHFASNHAASSAASEQTLLPCYLDTWIPRALYPVKIPYMHPLIGQSLGGREVTWLSDPQGDPGCKSGWNPPHTDWMRVK